MQTYFYVDVPSGIQALGLTVCLYMNLKHGKLDLSATTTGKYVHIIRC